MRVNLPLGFVGICVVVSLVFAVAETDSDIKRENGVYVLTESNFDKFLEQNPTALVEFYAPWCGHCKQLAPEYEKAAEMLDGKVALAKVDATVQRSLGTRFGVSGYPTLKFWREGTKLDYDGPRDADGIVSWINDILDPSYTAPPEAVIVLTGSNFTETVESADIILVEFYAPWCGHCKNLAPELDNAAKVLKTHEPPVSIAKIDATQEKDLSKQYEVTGYPTLYVMRRGKKYEYKGPRDSAGIISYMSAQASPAVKEFKSTQDFQRQMSKDDVTVVAYFDDSNAKLKSNFEEAAEVVREDFSVIGVVRNAAVAKSLNIEPNNIAIFLPERFQSKYEPSVHYFKQHTATRDEIVEFLNKNCVPLVGQRTVANMGRRYLNRPLVVVYYAVDFSPALREGTQFWRQKVLNVAKDFKSKYTFAISDEEEFSKELDILGLGDSGQDINIAIFGQGDIKYPWDPEQDDFSESVLRSFLKRMDAGKLKPHYRSAPVPKGDVGPVQPVVASTFNKIVMNKKKDVLIEFYAPWCGHCKKLEPKYAQLAKKLQAEKNLVIAKFDATANDVPSDDFKVEGFPTIYFSPAESKDKPPVKFTGTDNSAAELESFVRKHAKASFKKKTEL